jgi:hypothetical protein
MMVKVTVLNGYPTTEQYFRLKGVWTSHMDIKVGFVASPRDIVINSKEDRDALLARVEEFLAADTGTLKLEDAKGAVTLLVRDQVAFIEVGASAARTVGFI